MAAAALRLAREDDAEQIAAIYEPYANSTAVSFSYRAPTAEEYRERIRMITARLPWLVCERHGVVAGYAYAGPHRVSPAYRWSVETSVYVHPERHRTGVGRALYTALLEALRLLGYHRAYAGVTDPNPPPAPGCTRPSASSVSARSRRSATSWGRGRASSGSSTGSATTTIRRGSRACSRTWSAHPSGTPRWQPAGRCFASPRAPSALRRRTIPPA